MGHQLLDAAVALRAALEAFEPGEFSAADCFLLANELARTEKACAAARLLAASRATNAGMAETAGYKDGADWLAHQSGTSTGRARDSLRTADQLQACPETRDALRKGDISLEQATEIARVASEHPDVERELLPLARTSDLGATRNAAREQMQKLVSPEELRRRHFAARSVRFWQDRDGLFRLQGALPPEYGVALRSRIERAAQRLRRAAKERGDHPETFEAYAADALFAAVMAAGRSGPAEPGQTEPGQTAIPTASSRTHFPPGAGVEITFVCDLMAYRRGHAMPGEPCHIIGGGPIPVEIVKDFIDDAFIKVVLHDGTNIHTVHHIGRHIPAPLKTAIDLGPVPEFTGRKCRKCGQTFRIERDHIDPVANDGPTTYANLQPLCWHCHQAKSERDRRSGLTGGRPARGDPPAGPVASTPSDRKG